jgi:hypothetical protein
MQDFVTSRIDGRMFQERFLDLRRVDLQQDDESKTKWPERYDTHLIESRLRGDLSSEEFSKKWHELLGYKETKWIDVYERLFSDVDRFEADPTIYTESKKDPDPHNAGYYITEEELREKVKGYLRELEEE